MALPRPCSAIGPTSLRSRTSRRTSWYEPARHVVKASLRAEPRAIVGPATDRHRVRERRKSCNVRTNFNRPVTRHGPACLHAPAQHRALRPGRAGPCDPGAKRTHGKPATATWHVRPGPVCGRMVRFRSDEARMSTARCVADACHGDADHGRGRVARPEVPFRMRRGGWRSHPGGFRRRRQASCLRPLRSPRRCPPCPFPRSARRLPAHR